MNHSLSVLDHFVTDEHVMNLEQLLAAFSKAHMYAKEDREASRVNTERLMVELVLSLAQHKGKGQKFLIKQCLMIYQALR